MQGSANNFGPSDATMNSFSEKRDDGMKICKGPFNVNCTTDRDP
jgi:hypothetical protein